MTTTTFKKAVAEVDQLAPEMQDHIGQRIIADLEKWRELNAKLEAGERSLAENGGKPLEEALNNVRNKLCKQG